jgi:hypothetical protein
MLLQLLESGERMKYHRNMARPRSIRTPISKIKEALDELVEILEQSAERRASPKAKPQRAPKSNRAKSGGRKSSIDRDKIVALVRSKKRGMGGAQLAKALRVSPVTLGYHLKQLRQSKQLRTEGRTSSMRYFAS